MQPWAILLSIIPFLIYLVIFGVGVYVVYLLIKALRIYIDKNS
jgi:riboflavin transporter FmnP